MKNKLFSAWFCLFGYFIASFIALCANSSVNPTHSQTVFEETPSSLFKAIYQGASSLWVDGENGLFSITGGQINPNTPIFHNISDFNGVSLQNWLKHDTAHLSPANIGSRVALNSEQNIAFSDEQNGLLGTLKHEQSPLKHDDKEYAFPHAFVANNYVERHVLGFEYRLLGLDDSWQKRAARDNSARYSPLPFGNYEFQVRVVDPKSISEQAMAQYL